MKIKTYIFNNLRTIFKISFLEKCLRALVMGKSPNSFIAKLVPNNYQYPKNTIRSFSYKNINLKLDIHDYIGHFIYFGYKDLGHEKLMELIKPNNIIIDVGANYGTTILQFASLIGGNGRVFGFEPDPTNFEICNQNIKLNLFKNILVENLGLGNQQITTSLVVDTDSNRGGNRISNNINNKEAHLINVVKFDDWILQKNISKIDLIKIDVEGYELEVLKGAEQSIKKFKPILFIELDDNNLKLQNSSAKELISFLINLDYNIINSLTDKKVNLSDNFINCHFDIICK